MLLPGGGQAIGLRGGAVVFGLDPFAGRCAAISEGDVAIVFGLLPFLCPRVAILRRQFPLVGSVCSGLRVDTAAGLVALVGGLTSQVTLSGRAGRRLRRAGRRPGLAGHRPGRAAGCGCRARRQHRRVGRRPRLAAGTAQTGCRRRHDRHRHRWPTSHPRSSVMGIRLRANVHVSAIQHHQGGTPGPTGLDTIALATCGVI